jgi:hypothetical protein
VNVVQPADEQQEGDLLDDFERVGDAAGPEQVPDAVWLRRSPVSIGLARGWVNQTEW